MGKAVLLGLLTTLAVPAIGQEGVVLRDVVYDPGQPHAEMDIYFPPGAKETNRFPAVLVIHGGGFFAGDKGGEREVEIANTLAANGYVAASLNYALGTQRERFAAFPQNVHDCKTAVRFLRKNADRYLIVPGDIGAIGGSSGGNLAMLLGYTQPRDGLDPAVPYAEFSASIQAVGDLYGAADFTDTGVLSETLMAISVHLTREQRIAVSASTYVTPDDAPTLILHGTRDDTVPIRQSEETAKVLDSVGLLYQFVAVSQAGHGFDLENTGTDLRPVTIGFFHRYLKNNAPPAAPPGAVAVARVAPTRVDLSWSEGFFDETGFKIERSIDELSWDEVAIAGPNATAYSELGLDPGTTYYYRIRTLNPGGESAPSPTVRVPNR